jgi:Flp pilus assembly protein TadG
MLSPAVPIVVVQQRLRRFRRNRRGSVAIEVALVAPVFFALLFAIIETGIMFFSSQVLETMTQNSARMILTGQAQGAGAGGALDKAAFKNFVCGQIPALFTCGNVYVDVQNYPAFTNVVINSQIDNAGNFINNMKYCPGNGGDIVVVRLFYQWPIFVSGLGYNISNLSNGQRLLSATAAFKNEPFVANPSPCS